MPIEKELYMNCCASSNGTEENDKKKGRKDGRPSYSCSDHTFSLHILELYPCRRDNPPFTHCLSQPRGRDIAPSIRCHSPVRLANNNNILNTNDCYYKYFSSSSSSSSLFHIFSFFVLSLILSDFENTHTLSSSSSVLVHELLSSYYNHYTQSVQSWCCVAIFNNNITCVLWLLCGIL